MHPSGWCGGQTNAYVGRPMTTAALAEALEVTVHLSRSRSAVGAALRLRTKSGSGIATSCASPFAGLVQRVAQRKARITRITRIGSQCDPMSRITRIGRLRRFALRSWINLREAHSNPFRVIRVLIRVSVLFFLSGQPPQPASRLTIRQAAEPQAGLMNPDSSEVACGRFVEQRFGEKQALAFWINRRRPSVGSSLRACRHGSRDRRCPPSPSARSAWRHGCSRC